MNRISAIWVTAVVVALGIGLASCGMQGDQEAGQATLEVSSFPAADVWIDGKWKGSTPASLSVEPGAHEVVLRQSGFGEHQETIDVAVGGHRALECVLIAQDLDDEQVLAQLARPFDVTVEPFEAPERHRGGRKAPPAVLLWPQGDIRSVGLTTFALEVSEEYEGDGYLIFRKGKDILYKEPFDPETLTTVATIPLDVLQQTEVGDTVTWGIVFDNRRKHDVEGRFKVVSRPKADKRLSKMAYDRHLERQPPITRALLEAAALENYRLYSEALVRSLEVVQEHPTSVSPYQRIVTTLRRLGAEDTRLWSVASQYVSGGGRARASRSGIAAFAPQQAQALPVPSAPPGVATAPASPKPLQPGDAVKPGARSAGDPGSTSSSDPQAGTSAGSGTASGDPRALAAVLGQAAEEAGRLADERKLKADAAADAADQARDARDAAALEAEAKMRAHADAQGAYAEDPSPENAEAVEQARREAEAAEQRAVKAEQQANRTRQEADSARQEAEKAARSVRSLLQQADTLKQGAPAAGPGPGTEPQQPGDLQPGGGVAGKGKEKEADGPTAGPGGDHLSQDVIESQRACNDAQAEVDRLQELAAGVPEDEEIGQQLETARANLTQAQQARAEALAAYTAGATEQPADDASKKKAADRPEPADDPAPVDDPEPAGQPAGDEPE